MKGRTIYKFIIDFILWSAAILIAYGLRFEGQFTPYIYDIAVLTVIFIPVKVFFIHFFKLYRQSWHNISIPDLVTLTKAISASFIVFLLLVVFTGDFLFVPLSIPFIEAIVSFLILGGARVMARLRFEHNTKQVALQRSNDNPKNVLLAGAGIAGNMLVREMLRHPEMRMTPVGFIDDDPIKQKERFMGLPVFGTLDTLPAVASAKNIDMLLITMPTAPGKVIRKVVDMAKEAGVESKIIPGLYEIIGDKYNVSHLREVDVQDLLRREHVELDCESISDYLKNKVVMVTGAGGSIGSEIVRQITGFSPKQVLLLGRGENSIFNIESECEQKFPDIDFVSIIADVKNKELLEWHFKKYRPDVIFHAAAHKHVSLMEKNPEQAILNNIGGTGNMVDMALKYKVERFVNISSDKSVNPTSIMGTSKRVAEFLVEWGSCHAAEGQEFVSVRFGNVLGSRGSVVPLFKRQISQGGPVKITHPDMSRYFMTIPEASQLVIQAGGLGGNGSVYVLDMGEPIKIVDLAHDLIKLSGLKPEEDIEIVYTGMKPGEKMFEEILTEEESTSATCHAKIFSANTRVFPKKGFEDMLSKLFEYANNQDEKGIREQLKVLVPTFEDSTKNTIETK